VTGIFLLVKVMAMAVRIFVLDGLEPYIVGGEELSVLGGLGHLAR